MDFTNYLDEANEWYSIALKEFKEAEATQDEKTAIQVCEKSYKALLKSIHAFFIRKGLSEEELPKTLRGIYFFLGRYATREQRKDFGRLYYEFHIRGFHEGFINFDDLKENLAEVGEFIARISRDDSQ